MVIGEALASRRKTFLEDDEWWIVNLESQATLDYLPYGPHYRPFSDLERLYSRLPGIAESVQAHQISSTDLKHQSDGVDEKLERVAKFRSDLEHWYSDWTRLPKHAPRAIPSRDSTGITCDEIGNLFGTVFEFEDVRTSKAFTDYSLMMILILQWQHALSDLTQQTELDDATPAIPRTAPYAIDICRSVDYHMNPGHGQIAAFYISLPCRVAYYALPDHSREAQWLIGILETVATSNGVEFARNVLHNLPVRRQRVLNGHSRLLVSPATSGPESSTNLQAAD